ncbi:hypothetical protein Naga_100541g6 [Nannochloropsis gaditana]|uniref:Uncharacterized protein n=1 Tax=Nannochloropsis gaditana TaxID=72520 RepID=W7U2V6_9STRA|nr:hypothetical protein Naga_100541g6 [Nannochloropsis gaditana]
MSHLDQAYAGLAERRRRKLSVIRHPHSSIGRRVSVPRAFTLRFFVLDPTHFSPPALPSSFPNTPPSTQTKTLGGLQLSNSTTAPAAVVAEDAGMRFARLRGRGCREGGGKEGAEAGAGGSRGGGGGGGGGGGRDSRGGRGGGRLVRLFRDGRHALPAFPPAHLVLVSPPPPSSSPSPCPRTCRPSHSSPSPPGSRQVVELPLPGLGGAQGPGGAQDGCRGPWGPGRGRRQHEPHLNRGRAHLSHRRHDPAPPSLPLPPRQLHPLRPSFPPPRPRQAGGATCSHLKYPSETVPTCEATTRPLRATAPGGQYHHPSPFALTRSGSNPAGILNRRLLFGFKSRPNDGVDMYVCVQSKKNVAATSRTVSSGPEHAMTASP